MAGMEGRVEAAPHYEQLQADFGQYKDKQLSPIEQGLNELGNLIDQVAASQSRLQGRCEPITNPMTTRDSMSVDSQPTPPRSDVVNRLAGCCEGLHDILRRQAALLDSLDI